MTTPTESPTFSVGRQVGSFATAVAQRILDSRKRTSRFLGTFEVNAWVYPSVRAGERAAGDVARTNRTYHSMLMRASSSTGFLQEARIQGAQVRVCLFLSLFCQHAQSCKTMHSLVKPCKTMHNHAQPCKTVHSHAQPCTVMHSHAQQCKIVQNHAQPCKTVQNHAQPCTAMHSHAQQCKIVQNHTQPCKTVQNHAQPCTAL